MPGCDRSGTLVVNRFANGPKGLTNQPGVASHASRDAMPGMDAHKLSTTEAKMKGTAFVFIIIVLALLLSGWPAPIASSSEESATPSNSKSLQNLISPPSRILLADRTDTEDSISYGTDPRADRVAAERAREEKEKEQQAWIMLQHMYLNNDNGRNHKSNQPRSPQPGPVHPGPVDPGPVHQGSTQGGSTQAGSN